MTATTTARYLRVLALTALAMVAFAANSVLCRLALKHTEIDAASFTTTRILSGAAALLIIAWTRGRPASREGTWVSATALIGYAAAFSFAYVSLDTGVGALLLFAAVQVTMIVSGLRSGERLGPLQIAGLLLALGGLVVLLLPGATAPPLGGSVLMIGAGAAWGLYSLRGRAVLDPTDATVGNFVRAAPIALLLGGVALPWLQLDIAGLTYAVISGAVTSGAGYVVWYAALRGLTSTRAATVQLSVPVLAAFGGVALLGEQLTFRLVLTAVVILGGVALVIFSRDAGSAAAVATTTGPSTRSS